MRQDTKVDSEQGFDWHPPQFCPCVRRSPTPVLDWLVSAVLWVLIFCLGFFLGLCVG